LAEEVEDPVEEDSAVTEEAEALEEEEEAEEVEDSIPTQKTEQKRQEHSSNLKEKE
jgi:hypothetical protein